MKKTISFLIALVISCFPIATNALAEATISSVAASSDASTFFNPDHVTGIDYSTRTLFVGETTSAHIYNANTHMCDGLGRVEVDPDIMTYTYDEASETVTFTAVGPGLADIWIYEATCGVGANYQVLVIEREELATTAATTTTTESTDNIEETTSDDVVTTTPKVSLNNLPSELTLKSGEEVAVDFTAVYISSVEAISSDISAVSTEVEFEQRSMFANNGKLILTAGSIPETKTVEIIVEYGAMIQGYDGSKTIKVTVLGNDNVPSEIAGDANCDGQLNMADAVLIMQCISNPDKYKFTEQGEKNADVDGSGDVTNNDALKIQRFKLKLIDSLT